MQMHKRFLAVLVLGLLAGGCASTQYHVAGVDQPEPSRFVTLDPPVHHVWGMAWGPDNTLILQDSRMARNEEEKAAFVAQYEGLQTCEPSKLFGRTLLSYGLDGRLMRLHELGINPLPYIHSHPADGLCWVQSIGEGSPMHLVDFQTDQVLLNVIFPTGEDEDADVIMGTMPDPKTLRIVGYGEGWRSEWGPPNDIGSWRGGVMVETPGEWGFVRELDLNGPVVYYRSLPRTTTSMNGNAYFLNLEPGAPAIWEVNPQNELRVLKAFPPGYANFPAEPPMEYKRDTAAEFMKFLSGLQMPISIYAGQHGLVWVLTREVSEGLAPTYTLWGVDPATDTLRRRYRIATELPPSHNSSLLVAPGPDYWAFLLLGDLRDFGGYLQPLDTLLLIPTSDIEVGSKAVQFEAD